MSFARTRLPGQQDRALCGRNEAYLIEDGPHDGVPGLDDVQRVGLPEAVPQVVELRLRPDALVKALRHIPDLVGVQRIGHVIGGASLHCFDRLTRPLRRGHDDHLNRGKGLSDRPEGRAGIAPGLSESAEKVEIDEGEFIPPFPQGFKTVPDGGRRIHLEGPAEGGADDLRRGPVFGRRKDVSHETSGTDEFWIRRYPAFRPYFLSL
jgi:hypothetical protein